MTIVPPCQGPITGKFGDSGPYSNAWGYHLGVDVGVSEGTPIACCAPGLVEFAADAGPLGLCVVVGHQAGYRSLYAHLSRLDVVPGQFVWPGFTLGLSGNTGLSTGPHCHFEVWVLCAAFGTNPYNLTRDDPGALPAPPDSVWRGQFPGHGEGRHTRAHRP